MRGIGKGKEDERGEKGKERERWEGDKWKQERR